MTQIAIRIPDDINKRLSALAEKTHRTKTSYVREALLEYMDDLEAAYSASKVLKRVKSGREKTYSLAEVEAELGLND